MDDSRWQFLMNQNRDEQLTPEEVKDGWHFCWEFDGLLRNNKDEEFKCSCFGPEKPIGK